MDYKVDDKELDASVFISFVNKIWPGDYDTAKAQAALSETINITARDGETLVGCLRILTDGYFFGTITELLVLPEYRRRGVGSSFCSLRKSTRLRCFTLVRSPAWKPSMRRTAVRKDCSPIRSGKKGSNNWEWPGTAPFGIPARNRILS